MKNHYKIHQEHYDDFDQDGEDQPSTSTKLSLKNTTADESMTTNNVKPAPALKTEMLDWLRSDFDQVDLGASSTQSNSDRMTRSMKKLNVQQPSPEEDPDWVHLE